MSSSKDRIGILGVGMAACAVCCAGPILGFLAAAGIGTAIDVAAFGVSGLVVAAAVVLLALRRRRASTSNTVEPVPVAFGRSADG
jgi:hypothetical protein